ncbi:MAG: ATP-binding protein [Anderseniella sp.]|nr:ATP-binding protein [Anderseniella sp.]
MTQTTAPNLDDLNTLTAPAWLWDGERMRVVWANRAGVQFFGCSSLFDLIDMPFDDTDPGVARVRELARQVKRGESWQEVISFASAVSDEPFSAEVHVHALADGRSGLLLVCQSTRVPGSPGGHDGSASAAALQTGVLESLPVATVICGADGAVRFANAAARGIWRGSAPENLAGMTGGDVADSLMARADRAGMAGASARLKTGYGVRDFRLMARRLGEADDHAAGFSVVLEDVTDRRVLEQQTGLSSPASAAGNAPAAPEEQAAEPAARLAARGVQPGQTASGSLETIRAAIEAAGLASGDPPEMSGQRKPVAQPEVPPQAVPEPAGTATRFDVSPVVRKSLSAVKRAVLLYRGGKLVYANAAAARLLGYETDDDLAARHDIAAAVADVEGKAGSVTLLARDGNAISVRVEKSTFPWNDGAMPLAILSGAPTGTGGTGERAVTAAPPPAPEVQLAPEPPAEPDTPSEDTAGTQNEAVEPVGAGPDTASQPAVATENATRPEADSSEPAAGPAGTPASDGQQKAEPVDINELFSILDTASDGVVFLNETGDINWMSAGAEALFGVHAAGVIDTPLAALMDKPSAKTVRDYVAALGDRGLSSLFNSGREVTARMQDGGEVPLFLTMRRVGAGISGIPASAYCAVLRDITQWKKTEAELREARDRAEQSSRQKSEFLARMSHELRTPLNAILGFSDVMRKGEFGKLGNERYEGYANDIHTSGEYLLSLVNDLLDLSKVEAGKLDLNFTSVDLGVITDTCMKLMQNEATGARVVLRKSIAAGLPQVVADQRSVKQVILNLISNGIKFTDPGGQVIISARMTGAGELLLSVADTGVGMDEDQLREAMQPFSRIETVGREAQGTGLGLPLTKALVEANRARFSISSEPRKGTRIDITFPTTRVLAG